MPIFEFPADDALRLKGKNDTFRGSGRLSGRVTEENQFILREHPIWMAEEVSQASRDMRHAPFNQEVSIKIPSRASHYDVLQAVHQGQPSYR